MHLDVLLDESSREKQNHKTNSQSLKNKLIKLSNLLSVSCKILIYCKIKQCLTFKDD